MIATGTSRDLHTYLAQSDTFETVDDRVQWLIDWVSKCWSEIMTIEFTPEHKARIREVMLYRAIDLENTRAQTIFHEFHSPLASIGIRIASYTHPSTDFEAVYEKIRGDSESYRKVVQGITRTEEKMKPDLDLGLWYVMHCMRETFVSFWGKTQN